ncbi:TRAP-type C4-dicarboxylate transport system [Paramagnetospirillum caucaseum]|uniref:TRAP-type C4-dicarboxylate transport system n=1 Tax=Paramagnetospirillum caucaseum TaxID=1244869 RepID=M2Y5W8_9PROT|nr:TRAP transporter substrate-binding protein DctP [Paramagnetospirillum caucaseum]EME68466.1 TRAP-type C4-dicarboxylate transport system [Paramagnetospirillum caucaseum]
MLATAAMAAFAVVSVPLVPAAAETWTASYQFPPGDLRDDAMRSIARAMEPHGLTIRLYAAASLLRPGDQWGALTGGNIDMVLMPVDYLLDRFPQLAVLSLPTMIRSRTQAEHVSASPAMRELKRQIEAAGVVILADSWIPGAYASRHRCVATPADAKGLRARTIGRFMGEYWAGAGAVPVPVATSEALGTLVSNDLIDIANTSAATLLSLRMERKFACLTVPGEGGAMWYLYEPVMVSKRRYDSLDESRRQALHAAAAAAEAGLSASLSLLERRLAGNFIAAEVEVVKLDGAAMDSWQKLARRTAWKSFRDHVPGGGELMDKILAVE